MQDHGLGQVQIRAGEEREGEQAQPEGRRTQGSAALRHDRRRRRQSQGAQGDRVPRRGEQGQSDHPPARQTDGARAPGARRHDELL